MGVSARRGSSSQIASNMRAIILSLVVVAVTGDAKPWTVAQVAAGEPVKNAIADGRLHNIGVITNAAEAGVTHVGFVPHPYHLTAVPTAVALPNYYYGKREAEADPYTQAQVAAGQTAGGVITAIDYGHNTGGLRPLVHHVPAAYYHPYTAFYGKREAEAEPYTLAQVAAGQTAGGVITSVGGHPVVPFRSVPGYHHAYAVPHVYAAAPHVYYG